MEKERPLVINKIKSIVTSLISQLNIQNATKANITPEELKNLLKPLINKYTLEAIKFCATEQESFNIYNSRDEINLLKKLTNQITTEIERSRLFKR